MKNINQIITYCFITFVFNSFSQTVQFQDFILDGYKLKIDDITWKFQKGDGFSMSNNNSYFNAADSASVINLLIKVEEENPKFRIPKSFDLNNFASGNVILPERKTKCSKTLECNELENAYVSYTVAKLKNEASIIWDLHFGEHHHICSNCKKASKEFKKICPICKGTQRIYCNEKIICPVCKGSGVRIAESKTIKVSEGFKKAKEFLTFYFDSATDFGLYNVTMKQKIGLSYVSQEFSLMIVEGEKGVEDELTNYVNSKNADSRAFIEILSLINNGEIEVAKNQISKLNWPNSFPFYKELKDKENALLIEQIKNDLDNNNPLEASAKYKLLKTENNSFPHIKNEILIKLFEFYSNEVKIGKSDDLEKFIIDNKEKFKEIKLGKYYLTIEQDKTIKTDLPFEFNGGSLHPKYINHNEFLIPIKTNFVIEVSLSKQKIPFSDINSNENRKNIKYIVSEKYKNKILCVSRKGEYYLGKFGAPLNAKVVDEQYYSDELSGTNVNIEQLHQFSLYVNGFKISDGVDYFADKTIVAKKGIGRKIFRIITSPIWGPFYVYYLLSQ